MDFRGFLEDLVRDLLNRQTADVLQRSDQVEAIAITEFLDHIRRRKPVFRSANNRDGNFQIATPFRPVTRRQDCLLRGGFITIFEGTLHRSLHQVGHVGPVEGEHIGSAFAIDALEIGHALAAPDHRRDGRKI